MIMEWNFLFFMNSVLLGVGLAMDAFSVSLANGMNEKNMKKSRMAYIAGVYAFFQFLMPMIGWICVHTIVQVFGQIQKFIPWIALILLLYIGGSMVTFVICETGLCLGKTLGTKLSGKADVLGGVILIGIGIVSWGRGM